MWSNWSGSLKFKPQKILTPETVEELSDIVKNAANRGQKLRVAGAGHSSTPLVETKEILLSLKNFKGIDEVDTTNNSAMVSAGMTVKEAGAALLDEGLAMHNTGDVDIQTVAGAIGTGTHGTGKYLKNLSSMLIGVELVNGMGEFDTLNLEGEEDKFKSLRVALGSCGIFVRMKLKLLPKFKLYRSEWCAEISSLKNFEELAKNNRNFDFYWYPRSDMVKLRIMNKEKDAMPQLEYATLDKEMQGWSNEILPRERTLKFDEMEYALPAESGMDCFFEIRKRVITKHRKTVGWRILYRTVAADENFLSPAYQRETVTISLHHNAGLPFWEYFKDIEPIFIKHGGKPHWGKKNTLDSTQLKALYPKWETFMKFRKLQDPEDVFLSPYLQKIFQSQ